MNNYDHGSLQDKKTAADSGLYGNGSVYNRIPAAETRAYGANAYPARGGVPAGAYGNAPAQSRAAYDAVAAGGAQRQSGAYAAAHAGCQQPQDHARAYDTRVRTNASAQSYRTNYGAAGGGASASGGKSNGAGNGFGNGSGNGSGSNGRGSSSGRKPPKKKTFRQRLVAFLKRFLRSVYLFGRSISAWFKRAFHPIYKLEKPMRIFLASAGGFVVVCVIVIFSVSGARHKRAEALAAELALTTPAPTVAASATPEPTPSPTPEIRIEKGAEGEDVMALQKRLMELGYLAIDEPTSYFGHATKEAVKLFQRQGELQQDGICGVETMSLLNSDGAKPYVMYEGAEGDDIESFQEQLVELGYLESNQVTGYYGTDTLEAVKKFQNRNHLKKDGKAGEQTLEAINSPDARVSYTREQEIIAEKKRQAALARASSPAGRIDKMISAAKKQLGDSYVLGKSGPDSFDCSGLVVYCLRQANVYTRRLNAAGLSKTSSWTKVSDLDNVKRGDLLFFKSDDSSSIGHVGIYIGGGEMIDASSANGKVVRRSAKSSYWRRNFVVARRPIE